MDYPKDGPVFFIQFAGQGVKYIEELRLNYSNYPDIRPFVDESIARIKEQFALYDDSQTAFFAQGLEVDRWIEKPETTPDWGYLMSSPLSHPIIYLLQMSNYILLLQQGLDQQKLVARTIGATGFSTGIMSAILYSMNLPFDVLWKRAMDVQIMFFWQGIRSQQSMLRHGVRSELISELEHTPEGSNSCMASVNDLSRLELCAAIESFSTGEDVFLAYELLSNRSIVAGTPEALDEFAEYLKDENPDVVWRYIPSTIAAHCSFLDHAYDLCKKDVARIGLEIDGDDMQIPVFANNNGKDLSKSKSVIDDVMRAYFLETGSWPKQIAPMVEAGIVNYVLDFGPGGGVASLTEQQVQEKDVQVVRCSIPIGRMKLLDQIMPALD
jgi:fatty acid synthase subunit beta, fungi type